MGVWKGPFQDVATAGKFAQVLGRPDPVGAEILADEFFNVIGCDDFHDLLLDKDYRIEDARHYAARWVEGWLLAGSGSWSKPWDPDAVSIVKRALVRWESEHPEDWQNIPGDFGLAFGEEIATLRAPGPSHVPPPRSPFLPS